MRQDEVPGLLFSAMIALDSTPSLPTVVVASFGPASTALADAAAETEVGLGRALPVAKQETRLTPESTASDSITKDRSEPTRRVARGPEADDATIRDELSLIRVAPVLIRWEDAAPPVASTRYPSAANVQDGCVHRYPQSRKPDAAPRTADGPSRPGTVAGSRPTASRSVGNMFESTFSLRSTPPRV